MDKKLESQLKSQNDELKVLQDAMSQINDVLQNYKKVTNYIAKTFSKKK